MAIYRRKGGGVLWKFGGGGGRKNTTTTTMASIPEEIRNEILLKLPVKSLLACKCVCKDWYDLISTSHFVKTHIAIHRNNPNYMLHASIKLYSITSDSLASLVCHISRDDLVKMKRPFKSKHCFRGFLGSCDGLICIWLYELAAGYRDFFCLWNPATGEYNEIPSPPIHEFNVCMYGFGYDHKTNDYKLAIGVEVPGSWDSTHFQVYALSSNSWGTGQTIHYMFSRSHMSGVLINGNLHWLALGQSGFLLLSLDIGDESFKEMQLAEILEMKNEDLCLGVLRGCLCLFVGSFVNGVKSEVWEMLDYGILESWTKRYVIAQDSIINDHQNFSHMWSVKNGKILLLGEDFLVSYDPKHGSTRELKIKNIPISGAVNYFESLVSLNAGTYVWEEEEREKRIRKSREPRRRNSKKMNDIYCCFMIFMCLLIHIYVKYF